MTLLQDVNAADVATVIVAVLALVVSVVALRHSKRSAQAGQISAHAAQVSAQEAQKANRFAEEAQRRSEELLEFRHIRWELTGRPRREELEYELRNLGHHVAHHIRLTLPPGYPDLEIDWSRRRKDLAHGESVTFFIRRRAAAVGPVDLSVGNGSAAPWMEKSILDLERRLSVEDLPDTVVVSCQELGETEVALPKPTPPPA